MTTETKIYSNINDMRKAKYCLPCYSMLKGHVVFIMKPNKDNNVKIILSKYGQKYSRMDLLAPIEVVETLNSILYDTEPELVFEKLKLNYSIYITEEFND